MAPESGEQPLISEDGDVLVAANSEIYNFKDLYASLATPTKQRLDQTVRLYCHSMQSMVLQLTCPRR